MAETPVTNQAPAHGLLDPGRNCWRVEKTRRASLIVDAADYFRLARKAMMNAQSQIILVGWDLDTRLELVWKEERDGAPIHLGRFITWLGKRRPELQISILAWGAEAYSLLGRGTTLGRLASWRLFHPNIDFRLDSAHPLAGSHHQKILVIDDRFACCGGIDMTGSRWDTRAHRDHEPGRRRPTTHRRYGPWHDATMAVDADAARALGDLARSRWSIGCGFDLDPPKAESDPWPEALAVQFEDIEVGIARTCGKTDQVEEVREIEALFVDMIASAERFIYCESQYFASRKVAEAISKRLEEADPPEIVIVNPHSAEGWLEEGVMGAARADLYRAVKEIDRHDRLRLYYPVTAGRRDIYVHAKLMIVDDRLLRVGSANLNNRSMGLDSECDLLIEARGENEAATRAMISRLRCDLLAEHLGIAPDAVDRCHREDGSLIACVERLRGPGRTLVPYAPPDFSSLSKTMARSETADPASAEAPFEPRATHRLFRGLRRGRRRR